MYLAHLHVNDRDINKGTARDHSRPFAIISNNKTRRCGLNEDGEVKKAKAESVDSKSESIILLYRLSIAAQMSFPTTQPICRPFNHQSIHRQQMPPPSMFLTSD